MVRHLLVIAVLAMGTLAHAEGNTISGVLSFSHGGNISLGAEFEREMERNNGFGGYFRFFQKEDSGPNQMDGFTMIGGDMRIHVPQKRWDLSVAPGFAIINIDSNDPAGPNRRDDTTTLGPSLFLTALYQINANVALGLEQQTYQVWMDKDWAGTVLEDIAFKFSASF